MPQENAYFLIIWYELVMNACARATLSGEKDKEAVSIALQFRAQISEGERKALGVDYGEAGFYPALARLAYLKLQEARQGVETTEKVKVPDIKWLEEMRKKSEARWQQDKETRQKVKALSESRFAAARSRFYARLRQKFLEENPELKQNPELLDRLVESTGEAIEANSPAVSFQGRLSKEDRTTAIEAATPEITQYAQLAGINPQKLNLEKIVEESSSELDTIAADPQRFVAAEYKVIGEKPTPVVPAKPKEPVSLKSFIIPPEVVQKVVQPKTAPEKPQGAAFAAVASLTNPAAAAAQVKSTAVSFQTVPLIAFVNALSGVPEEAKTAFILGLGLGPTEEGKKTPHALYVESPPNKPPAFVFFGDQGNIIPQNQVSQTAKNVISQQFNLGPYIYYGPRTEAGIPVASPAIPPGIGTLFLAGARPEHFRLTAEVLEKAGLPKDHPTLASLRLYQQQAVDYEKQHPFIMAGLRIFYEPLLQKGMRPLIPQLGIPLETGVKPIWETSKTAGTVRNAFNQFGLRLGTHAEVTTIQGTKVIQFVLFDRVTSLLTGGRFVSWTAFRSAIYQRTIGAGLRFLAGTAIGKAAIELGKKAAIWIATKLGIQLGLAAAGTAIAPGVGTVIGLVVGFAIDISLKILGKVKDLIISFIKEPEKAAAAVALGLIGLILLPAPFIIIAFIPLIIGGIALVGALGSGVGATLAAIGGGVVGFFTLLLISPFAAAIGLLVVSVIAGLSILTFFIIMVTGAAFVAPLFPTASQLTASRYPFNNPATIAAPANTNFQWPAKTTSGCSSNFGFRNIGTGCGYHEGLDILASYLSDITPSAPGTVENIGYTDLYGNYVVVKHGDSFYSLYGHLAEINVTGGQAVNPNTVLGLSGNTGNVVSGDGGAGYHLHFGFSDCSVVPACFNDGTHTPDPCAYFSCPNGCGFQDQQSGCQL